MNISYPDIDTIIIHVVTMLCVIALSALLVEYMNDGSIYNRAFNTLCVITILLHLVVIGRAIYDIIFWGTNITPNGIELDILKKHLVLVIFNNLYRIAMVFLFTFFAYDSAKKQLSKVDFSK